MAKKEDQEQIQPGMDEQAQSDNPRFMAMMSALGQSQAAEEMPPMPPEQPMPMAPGAEAMSPAPMEGEQQTGFVSTESAADSGIGTQTKMTHERITEAMNTFMRYKSAKERLDGRLVEVEQWWKMRHWKWMQEQGRPDDMTTTSAWLFNVIMSKHADGMQSNPEPNILPREEQDKETAGKLNSIVPCVMDENDFEKVYSDVLWQKLKGGTGAYGVFWNSQKLNGLGDIDIKRLNLLHLFWEPGIDDIQDSQNVFYAEEVDIEQLKQQYPELKDEHLGNGAVTVRKYHTEDVQNNSEKKTMVVDWYYHTWEGPKKTLHYCKFVNEHVLYASEDDPELAERGFYDHGLYPFVLDPLFPIEGSPCGFGYIDICKNAQEQIDILDQAVIKNTLVNAIPRYMVRSDGSINEAEFMDFTRPVVHVNGTLGTDSVMPITPTTLNGNCMAVIQNKIAELKETSGNTDAGQGISSSNQAASAIAALQEAAGKTTRDMSMSAYRAYCKVVNLVVELIRQFYDMPRQFRIIGEQGQESFMSFDNSGMQMQQQGVDFGVDMGMRLPVFDIKVSAQTKNSFSKNSQNELALTLYGQGLMNPQNTDQSLMVLDMMEFEGKDELMQKVQAMGTMQQQLVMFQQIALQLAQQYDPMMAQQIAQTIMTGAAPQGGMQMAQGAPDVDLNRQNKGGSGGNMTKLANARERAQNTGKIQ